MNRLIVELKGGLGNQMFQYAAAKAAASRNGRELLLDLSWFVNNKAGTLREYGLHIFENAGQMNAEPALVARYHKNSFSERLWRLASSALPLPSYPFKAYVREQGTAYQNSMEHIETEQDVYLTGYWQSERYFKDYEDEIRKCFVFPEITEPANMEAVSKILSVKNMISLHVRRGDYVHSPETATVHGGICDFAYYNKALSFVLGHVKDVEVMVFSDEPEWAGKNIKLPCPATYVSWNSGTDSFRDMQLMSLCSHHIIANSSFSWWGAWLGCKPDKIVCAPLRWFAKDDIVTSDMIPENWMRID